MKQKPMRQDPIRKALESYLADLLFLREDAAGVLVKPVRDLRNSDDESFLYWYKINDAIRRLGGSWIKDAKFTQGHWRIPK